MRQNGRKRTIPSPDLYAQTQRGCIYRYHKAPILNHQLTVKIDPVIEKLRNNLNSFITTAKFFQFSQDMMQDFHGFFRIVASNEYHNFARISLYNTNSEDMITGNHTCFRNYFSWSRNTSLCSHILPLRTCSSPWTFSFKSPRELRIKS
jgi:hypothetical protein